MKVPSLSKSNSRAHQCQPGSSRDECVGGSVLPPTDSRSSYKSLDRLSSGLPSRNGCVARPYPTDPLGRPGGNQGPPSRVLPSILDPNALTHPELPIPAPGAGSSCPRGPGPRCQYPSGWVLVTCEHGGVWWVPSRCNGCEGCRELRRQRRVAQVIETIQASKWVAVMTLTSRRGMEWPVLMRRFQSLVKALRQEYGRIEYAAFKEEGSETGMKHLHVVVRGWVWVPHAKLRAMWRERTGAFHVNITRIHSGGQEAANYVSKHCGRVAAKHCSKAVGAVGPGKRVTFSKGFLVKRPECKRWVTFFLYPRSENHGLPGLELPCGTVVEKWCESCLSRGPPDDT